MNVLLASDNNFVQHCCVTITSVLINNPATEFYLFTEGLTEENSFLLKSHVENLGGKLNILTVSSEQVKDFPMPPFMSSHISIATYYRLFAAKLLPESIEKVIYLDCDIIVTGDLREMWNFPIENYALGAVYQSHEHSDCNATGKGPHAYSRLGIPPEDGYFNAGVLLLNLKYWRENKVTERLFTFIKEHYNLIHAHDQDTLNAVLHAESAVLEPTWNYRECFIDGKHYTYPSKVNYQIPLKRPKIIHFVSKPKPWQYYCKHPLKSEYYTYLSQTPYKGYRPNWNWREFKQHVIMPCLFSCVIKLDIFKLRRIIKYKK